MWTISINSAINNGENAHYDEFVPILSLHVDMVNLSTEAARPRWHRPFPMEAGTQKAVWPLPTCTDGAPARILELRRYIFHCNIYIGLHSI